jgi:predicted phosphatase
MKLIIFDFDDTLFLKTTYDFIPNLKDLIRIKNEYHLIYGIVTYNKKAYQLLQTINMTNCFDFILHIDSKQKLKSTYIQDIISKKKYTFEYSDILFFDNDPFNVFDVNSLMIHSFLVNPINGLCFFLFESLLNKQYMSLYNEYIHSISHTTNYIERTRLVQNLGQLKILIDSPRFAAHHDIFYKK